MRRVFSTQAIQSAIEKSLPDFQKIAGSSAVRTQDSVRRQFARDESHFMWVQNDNALYRTISAPLRQL